MICFRVNKIKNKPPVAMLVSEMKRAMIFAQAVALYQHGV